MSHHGPREATISLSSEDRVSLVGRQQWSLQAARRSNVLEQQIAVTEQFLGSCNSAAWRSTAWTLVPRPRVIGKRRNVGPTMGGSSSETLTPYSASAVTTSLPSFKCSSAGGTAVNTRALGVGGGFTPSVGPVGVGGRTCVMAVAWLDPSTARPIRAGCRAGLRDPTLRPPEV